LHNRTEPSATRPHEGRAGHSKVALWAGPEGHILLLGVAVTTAFLLWLAAEFFFSPEQSQILMGTTATAAVFGRAAGLAFGYSMGLSYRTVIPICMIVETVLVHFLHRACRANRNRS